MTAERRVAAVRGEALGDLRGELARRGEDERLRLPAARQLLSGREPRDLLRQQVLEDRKGERGGLAGARLRDAEEISPREKRRDRPRLDRRRALVPVCGERVPQRLGERELGEGRHGHGLVLREVEFGEGVGSRRRLPRALRAARGVRRAAGGLLRTTAGAALAAGGELGGTGHDATHLLAAPEGGPRTPAHGQAWDGSSSRAGEGGGRHRRDGIEPG
jgi:hypothetical protein